MATFTGTGENDSISPGGLSDGVVASLVGARPSEAAYTLEGLGGDDTLDGGAGGDQMFGGGGADTYIVDDASDEANDTSSDEIDKVEASVDFELGDNIEDLLVTGVQGIPGTGNSLDNRLRASGSGNHTLLGFGGIDVLNGGDGDDAAENLLIPQSFI